MPTDHTDHWLETYKSLILISLEAIKFCALINGGAIVALLAYLGNVASKTICVVPDMQRPMGAFIMGLMFCGIAFLTSYLTQLSLLNEISADDESAKHAFFLKITVLFYLLSGLSFCAGGWLSIMIFTNS